MQICLGGLLDLLSDPSKRPVRGLSALWIERATQGAFGLGYAIANRLALIGETEAAMTWLERAYDEGEPLLICTKTDPRLDSLRSDPRFPDLLRRIGFPEN